MKKESPLRITVENDELVIRIGIDRLQGNDDHPTVPALTIINCKEWGESVKAALNAEEEDGSTIISDALDKGVKQAIDAGSLGLDSW